MRGRFLIVVAAAVGASAWVASASDPGAQSAKRGEPAVTAAQAIQLPSASSCAREGRVRISFAPPAGVTFAVLTVRAGGEDALQLAGLTGPGTLTVRLPDARARIRVSATTSGGQFLDADRTYQRCATRKPTRQRLSAPPKARPKPKPVVLEEGGGED